MQVSAGQHGSVTGKVGEVGNVTGVSTTVTGRTSEDFCQTQPNTCHFSETVRDLSSYGVERRHSYFFSYLMIPFLWCSYRLFVVVAPHLDAVVDCDRLQVCCDIIMIVDLCALDVYAEVGGFGVTRQRPLNCIDFSQLGCGVFFVVVVAENLF